MFPVSRLIPLLIHTYIYPYTRLYLLFPTTNSAYTTLRLSRTLRRISLSSRYFFSVRKMNLVRNIKRRTGLRDPEDAQLRYTIYLERIRPEVKSASRNCKGEMVREKEANKPRGNFQELRNNSCARNRLRIASETKDGPSPRNDQRRREKERKTQREKVRSCHS